MIAGEITIPAPDAPIIPLGLIGASIIIAYVIFLFWKNPFGKVLLTILLTVALTTTISKVFF